MEIYIENEIDENNDIRIKLLLNKIDKEKFKKILYARDKKNKFKIEYYRIIVSTFDIAESIIWNIFNTKFEDQFINITESNFILLEGLKSETNLNIEKICKAFNYKNTYELGSYFDF